MTSSTAAAAAASLLRSLGLSPSVVRHNDGTSYTVDSPGVAEILIGRHGGETTVVVAINRLDGDAAAQLDALAS